MKFLVFQHVLHEHPGRISEFCKEKGIELDIVELWKPYKMPAVTDYNALIIMGGPMGVYDDYPSKKDEMKEISSALKNQVPVLGFCLGSQLLAHALGAKVYPNMFNGKHAKEVGFFDVELTEHGKKDPLLSGLTSPLTVLQWHGDAFDIPKGSVKLASSTLCANQAFRHGNSYGLLFHLEFTPQMIEKQIEVDREWMHKDNKVDEKEIIRKSEDDEKLMDKNFRKLFDNFISAIKP